MSASVSGTGRVSWNLECGSGMVFLELLELWAWVGLGDESAQLVRYCHNIIRSLLGTPRRQCPDQPQPGSEYYRLNSRADFRNKVSIRMGAQAHGEMPVIDDVYGARSSRYKANSVMQVTYSFQSSSEAFTEATV